MFRSRSRCFNGAAARKPRNPPRTAVARCQARRFNGAAARKPRNPGHSSGRTRNRRASMEPRLESRGISEWCASLRAAARASMEPRLESRGICLRPVVSPTFLPASMEPRLESRGINSRDGASRMFISLQWSRGSKAAESIRSFAFVQLFSGLQWSRGSKAAESGEAHAHVAERHASMEPRLESRGIFRPDWRQGPDGNASMEPRLESRGITAHAAELTRIDMLQWSRGSKAAESAGRNARRRDRRRFNGAAARKPRNPAHSVQSRQNVAGFNGAAARKPRNHEIDRYAPSAGTASMEPRLESRGIERAETPVVEVDPLQWSRGSKAAESLCSATSVDVIDVLQWSRGSKAAESG